MSNDIGTLKLALELAGKQFAFYEQQHLAKSPPDVEKARTNHQFALMCAAAVQENDFDAAVEIRRASAL